MSLRRILLAAFAAPLALVFPGSDSSLAQQGRQCGPTEIGIGGGSVLGGFLGEASVDVLACARGDVLISQGSGLPALRRLSTEIPERGFFDIFTFRPCELPLGSDVPGAQVKVSLVTRDSAVNASQTFTLDADKQKPTLTTTSDPPRGSRVTPRRQIVVRMHADERYGEARVGWQSGVKKVLLRDESRNMDVPPHWEASGGAAPCDHKHWEETLQVTYEVPEDPPPVIRLRACAWDHAGNQDCDTAAFPTGEWHGELDWSMRADAEGGSWTRFFGKAEIAVSRTGDNRLNGSIQGTAGMEGEDRGTPSICGTIRTLSPTIGRARLVGSLSPDGKVMSLRTEEVRPVAQGRISPCSTAQLPAPTADFAVLLHTETLRLREDATFHASGTTPSGSNFSISLRPSGR